MPAAIADTNPVREKEFIISCLKDLLLVHPHTTVSSHLTEGTHSVRTNAVLDYRPRLSN
jgi:hypothetical protein